MNNYFWIGLFLACACFFPAYSRNYRHAAKELKTTNQVVISQTDCAKNETPVFIHTAAVTSGKYFDRRMTIRKTWGAEAKNASIKLIFVIGIPKNLSLERALKKEATKYGDILQFNFVEDYYNLTLKAIAELKWAYRHCNASQYLMKVDDDVLVNVPLLKLWVNDRAIPSGITGRIMTTPANRHVGHKWYMPRQYYDRHSYKFLSGFSYLLSMNRLKKLLDSIKRYRGPVLDIDDLWLTGVMADYGRIKRFNNHRFRYYCGLDTCTMHTSLVMHACADSRNTEIMYNVWKETEHFWCHDDPFEREFKSDTPAGEPIPDYGPNSVAPLGRDGSQLFNFNLGDLRFVVQSK